MTPAKLTPMTGGPGLASIQIERYGPDTYVSGQVSGGEKAVEAVVVTAGGRDLRVAASIVPVPDDLGQRLGARAPFALWAAHLPADASICERVTLRVLANGSSDASDQVDPGTVGNVTRVAMPGGRRCRDRVGFGTVVSSTAALVERLVSAVRPAA